MDPVTIGAVIGLGKELIERFIPDKEKQAEAKLELARMTTSGELEFLRTSASLATGQLEVNKQEAAHRTVFVAGWRPYLGWMSGFALTWQFILAPILGWVAVLNGIPVPPALDIGPLITIIMGMLGLGTLRTYEKLKGVAR